MHDMTESVKKYDILSPAIARLCPAAGSSLSPLIGGSGGGKLAGLETMPVIVRELDDDAAAILVVDSNSQREGLFPSERAFTHKLKLEALRQSARKQI